MCFLCDQTTEQVGLWKNIYVLLLWREPFLDGFIVCEVLSHETQIPEGLKGQFTQNYKILLCNLGDFLICKDAVKG